MSVESVKLSWPDQNFDEMEAALAHQEVVQYNISNPNEKEGRVVPQHPELTAQEQALLASLGGSATNHAA